MRNACALVLMASGLLHAVGAADAKVPTPQFQGDFFGEMARSFACVVGVDPTAQTMTVVLDRDGSQVIVPIRADTELHFRDSWGELGNYFPGQHVMLFVYVDEERKWTYPRAVQDDLHVAARHGWFAKITAIDPSARTYSSVRDEKDGQGRVVKQIANDYVASPDAKVWKGSAPGAFDTLAIGDEVIQQLVLTAGRKIAVEIVDRNGDKAIAEAQDAQHRKDEDGLGLPSYVTDVNVIDGGLTLTVPWCSAARAKTLKPGQAIALKPGNGSAVFAAAISEIQEVDTRARLKLVINARVAARLSYGQSLRLFMPGTGPELPSGRSGIPVFAK